MACRAAVAQLVEQRIRNAKVASSIPASGTSKDKAYSDVGLFLLWWNVVHVGTQAMAETVAGALRFLTVFGFLMET